MLPEARDAFISALQAAPAEPASHLNLGVWLVRMEKWGEAMGPLGSYRQMVPEDVRGWALGGQAAAQSGNVDGAIQLWLEQSLYSHPHVAAGLATGGVIGLWLGHRDQPGLRPLLTDLQLIMIGPAWLLSVLYRRLGVPF